MTIDNDGNLKIRPPITAEEHQQVQREEKARTILLFALPNEHMGDFYHMIDARDIWNAIKARFGENAESKKMQKSLLKQKFEEFKVSEEEGLDKGYDKTQKILTQMNTLKIKPDPEDVNMKFLRGLPPFWSDKQRDFEEYDLKHQMEMLSIKAKWNNSGKNLYKLIDSSMSVRTKRGLGLDIYIGEGELGIDDSKFSIFHTNSDELEGQPIYNRFASVDHMKAVPPPLTGNYMPPFNIPNIDESQMVYGKKATDSSKIKTNDDSISHSHDSVLFYFSDRSSKPSTSEF
nr:xylulose kinase-1 [Tanacetum cinerariifolium]